MMLRHLNKLRYLGLIFLTSCTFTPKFDKHMVVVAINQYNDYCIYGCAIKDSKDLSEVRDLCGKFNIGDTLKLTK